MIDGCIRVLSDVRYIPEIKRNLISLGLLEQKGCMFTSAGGKMVVKKGGKVVMQVESKRSLYYLLATVQIPSNGEVHAVGAESLRLWHIRLGHPAEGIIRELVKKGVVQGSEENYQTPCEECILGMSKKLPYPKGKHSSSQPLDYAHSHLWGPAQESSIGGGRYYTTIIDDFSRKIWIYVLKEKSEAFKKFRDWCVEVEMKKGSVLKCLRTDNGLEYLSREFDEFCEARGIKRHRTVPLNPQQNCVAERANRTIMERVRCMLLSAGMEKEFWVEAASTAVKMINKCPSSSIDGDTPDFRWYGKHGNYSRLKIYRCKAFAHIKQGKLEARALRCVMLGYQSGVKGYRLWCIEPGNPKIIVSRDVVLLEKDMPFLKKENDQNEKQTTASFEVETEELEKAGQGVSKDDAVSIDQSSREDVSESLRD